MRTTQAFGLIVIATVVATISGSRLGASEDFLRSQQCGKAMQNKIYNGTKLSGKEAPWLVQVNSTNNGAPWLNTGFFISDRHVLASSDAFLDFNQANFTNTFRWVVNLTYADMKSCRDRIMPVPGSVLKSATLHTCVDAKTGEDCQKSAALPVVSASYIGNCDTSIISYGFIVFELATPVKSITPLCVPKTRLEEVGDVLLAYGAGYEDDSDKKSSLASHTTKVINDCKDEQNATQLGFGVCLDYAGVCRGDFGGPVTKVVDSQRYAVAALWSWGCEVKRDRKKHISVGVLSPQICKVTGVCQSSLDSPTTTAKTTTTRKPLTTTTTAAKSKSRLVISKHFVLTKIAE